MAILPVTLRRRLRSSGFTEEQTDVLDEVALASREGLVGEDAVERGFHSLRLEIAGLRSDMNAMKWWLFGSLSVLILAAVAAIIAAIAAWG